MERHYRLAARATARRRREAPLRCARMRAAAPALMLASFLVAWSSFAADCEGGQEIQEVAAGNGTEQEASQALELPDELPIIVTLFLKGETEAESADAIAEVTARVVKRLETTMPPEDFAAVRTFSFFPVIALNAGPGLIFQLLAMPEVASIERDHELQALGDAPDAQEPSSDGMEPVSATEPVLDLQLE